MRITVIGAGYVGLVVSVCLACADHQVTCMEKDVDRCRLLLEGQCPILEKELSQMLLCALEHGRINFTDQPAEAIPNAEIIFIAVGTPAGQEGYTDLSDLMLAVETMKEFMQSDTIVVIKSSVPPGTTSAIHNYLLDSRKMNEKDWNVHVVCNPEFLREGTAVDDFLMPDRIVIGTDDLVAANKLLALYHSVLWKATSEIITSPLNAELIKYASNSYLAVRLSFINELARLCEKLGGSIQEVALGMGADHRIGKEYLSAGLGYGGACLPKDTCALVHTAKAAGTPLTVLESAISANSAIPYFLAEKISNIVPTDGIIAVWGLSFKTGTEDMRNSPVLSLMAEVQKCCTCRFKIYDPTRESVQVKYPETLETLLYQTPEETAINADALIIGTAWPQFRNIDLDHILTHMRGRWIFDFANVLDKTAALHAGFNYYTCGEAAIENRSYN